MRKAPWLGMDSMYSDTVEWERIDMELVGGCLSRGRLRVFGVSPWGHNYYLAHCLNGILDVRGYQEIRFEGVWPGVDWVLRYEDGRIKQEFVVQAGYDYGQVRLRWWGVGDIQVGEGGQKLRVVTEYGELVEDGLVALYGMSRLPLRYHLISRTENEAGLRAVEVGYQVEGAQEPLRATLVLDPVLYWGTYFGGDGVEAPHCITTNANGELFVAGQVGSSATNFPVYNPGGGAYQQNSFASQFFIDAFIAKFTTNLSLAWCTYFGCPGSDFIHDIQTDPTNGNIYVTGYVGGFPAHYAQFPFAQPNPNAYFDNSHNGANDAFVARFSGTNLSLQWSTLFGGDGNEFGYGIAIRPNGDVFICGSTQSSPTSFPLLNPGGAYFDNSLGGQNDDYVAMFRGSDLNLRWCTYLGGSGTEFPFGIAAHNNTGDILVVGRVFSADFPRVNPGGGAYFDNTLGGSVDGFISRFRSSDLALVWSTYFGGDGEDDFTGISAGVNIYVVGTTTSNNLPLHNNIGATTYMQNTRGGGYDLVIASFEGTNNAVRWSTYYGGQGSEISWVPQEVSVGVGYVAFGFFEIQNTGAGFSTYLMNNNCPSFLQANFGGQYDVGFLVFTGNGQRVWSTFYGDVGFEGWGTVQMVGSTILYAAISTTSDLPATHLRNPGGGAYYDGTRSSTDVVILRFDQVNCPLFYQNEESMNDERPSRWEPWKATIEQRDLVIRGVREPGSYFLLSDLSGKVVGRWAVETEEFRVSLPVTPGVYVLREEISGHVQKVVYSP